MDRQQLVEMAKRHMRSVIIEDSLKYNQFYELGQQVTARSDTHSAHKTATATGKVKRTLINTTKTTTSSSNAPIIIACPPN